MIYLLCARSLDGEDPVKGSDKWGEGRGPRVEVVLAALVAVSLAGVYFFYIAGSGLSSGNQAGTIATVSTTGFACDSDMIPQNAQQVERDPAFTELSNGLCYNYIGESGGVLTFAYYDGTITYPCGDSPLQLPVTEILVNVTAPSKIASAKLLGPQEMGSQGGACDMSLPVKVVSLQDVGSTIPAVPQLNLTLVAPPGGRSVVGLHAVLTLDGGSQTFLFGDVSSTTPLTSKSVSSIEIVLSNLSFGPNKAYPMTISGTFDNGELFSHLVRVQVARVH